MRLAKIELSWFRGAAKKAVLPVDGKSVVVYGANGSGKSTFVDAIELLFNDLKLDHLRHEYSGKQQELGLINTHRPSTANTSIDVTFSKSDLVSIAFDKKGGRALSGSALTRSMIQQVKKYRTLLRQDEISKFINMVKSDKYNSLLPLLGLDEFQTIAANLRGLSSALESESKLGELRNKLEIVSQRLKERVPDCLVNGKFSEEKALEVIAVAAKGHLETQPATIDFDLANGIAGVIKTKISKLEPVRRRYFHLEKIKKNKSKERVASYRDAVNKLSQASISAVDKKLTALDAAYQVFIAEQNDAIPCPACGRPIEKERFLAHYNAEKEALKEVSQALAIARQKKQLLFDECRSLLVDAKDPLIAEWEQKEAVKKLIDGANRAVTALGNRDELIFDHHMIDTVEQAVIETVGIAEKHTAEAPSEFQDLATEVGRMEAIGMYPQGLHYKTEVRNIDALKGFINSAEEEVRKAIASKANAVIKAISDDLKLYWEYLHPGSKITDITLFVPDDGSKAVDIKLKFFGKDQDSPRNTLSEGQRNSLGLCIFLAIAKQDDALDLPIVLDDVITSLDSEHQYFLAEMIKKEFSHRQLLIFTHNREWFSQLKLLLGGHGYLFRALAPWVEPGVGIVWTGADEFAEAKG